MTPDLFEIVAAALLLFLLFLSVKLAYDEGIDEGIARERGRWYSGIVEFVPSELPATRHDRETVTDRTFPYRGEVE